MSYCFSEAAEAGPQVRTYRSGKEMAAEIRKAKMFEKLLVFVLSLDNFPCIFLCSLL